MNTQRTPTDVKQTVGKVVLGLWAPAIALVVASLMVGHWVPLPTPEAASAELPRRLAELRDDVDATQSWAAFHVLYADCRCSHRVFDHLVEDERNPRVRDIVLLVGEDDAFAEACSERGYELRRVTPQELEERFGVVAAPMLIVTAPDGGVRYIGGYTSRKQGFPIEDLRIIDTLLVGEIVEPLPVYGCGVAASLQEALDPLGLKN